MSIRNSHKWSSYGASTCELALLNLIDTAPHFQGSFLPLNKFCAPADEKPLWVQIPSHGLFPCQIAKIKFKMIKKEKWGDYLFIFFYFKDIVTYSRGRWCTWRGVYSQIGCMHACRWQRCCWNTWWQRPPTRRPSARCWPAGFQRTKCHQCWVCSYEHEERSHSTGISWSSCLKKESCYYNGECNLRHSIPSDL